ncbi:hypothetical protein J6590_087040 [Homalodisca vitripennis]|nr:hypothetical protein J6590_087040 [Homalodisca vitripennis]
MHERKVFLKDLSLQLARPSMEKRLKKPLSKELAERIKKSLGIGRETLALCVVNNRRKQGRCSGAGNRENYLLVIRGTDVIWASNLELLELIFFPKRASSAKRCAAGKHRA